jgi:hypothetical protein
VVDVEGLLLSCQFRYCFVQAHKVLKTTELGIAAVKFLRVLCKQKSVFAHSALHAYFFD